MDKLNIMLNSAPIRVQLELKLSLAKPLKVGNLFIELIGLREEFEILTNLILKSHTAKIYA